MRKIVVTVETDGTTQVEAIGFKGGACVKATAPLTKALIGGSPDSQVKKPEFYQSDYTVPVKTPERG